MNFGSIFGKVVGSVRNAVENISNQIRSQFAAEPSSSRQTTQSSSAPQQSQMTNISFSMTTSGLSLVASRAAAGILVHLDQDVSTTLMESIGEMGVERFKEALEPIRRTGEVSDSFTYRIVNGGRGVVIYSDHPAARSIQYGYSTGGSIEALTDWMKQKAEFRNLSEKEQIRAAYFIIKKVKKGFPPGATSDLRRLAPVGERRYDYLSVVGDSLGKDVDALLTSYMSAANEGL